MYIHLQCNSVYSTLYARRSVHIRNYSVRELWTSYDCGYADVGCRLIDKLSPGKINWNDKTFQVPKIEAMRIMRERERIAMFSKLVQEYGVPDAATFPTESLHEKGALNLAQVCVCLRTLGMEVHLANVSSALLASFYS